LGFKCTVISRGSNVNRKTVPNSRGCYCKHTRRSYSISSRNDVAVDVPHPCTSLTLPHNTQTTSLVETYYHITVVHYHTTCTNTEFLAVTGKVHWLYSQRLPSNGVTICLADVAPTQAKKESKEDTQYLPLKLAMCSCQQYYYTIKQTITRFFGDDVLFFLFDAYELALKASFLLQ